MCEVISICLPQPEATKWQPIELLAWIEPVPWSFIERRRETNLRLIHIFVMLLDSRSNMIPLANEDNRVVI